MEELLLFFEVTERRLTTLGASRPTAWWPCLRVFMAQIRVHPLTGRWVADPPRDGPCSDGDLSARGRRAWGLVRLAERGDPGPFGDDTPEVSALRALMGPRGSPAWSLLAAGLMVACVRPMMAWLRALVLADAVVDHVFDTWAQEAETFGVYGGFCDVCEGDVQHDLRCFLSDAGLRLWGMGGPIDLWPREDEIVPVDVHVWEPKGAPPAWDWSSAEYPPGLAVRRVVLVVVNTSTTHRIVPAKDLRGAKPFVRRGVALQETRDHRAARSDLGSVS